MEDKQYKYVYGIGKTALDIPESEIRYAMDNTKSNAEAARFLKVSFILLNVSRLPCYNGLRSSCQSSCASQIELIVPWLGRKPCA